jgi:cobalt-zinc-cadmium efflux system outer membrane protein
LPEQTSKGIDASVFFPVTGGKTDLDLSVTMSFLDIFYLSLRKRVAAARFEEAKLQVTGSVLDFAMAVRTAFYRHQANEQTLELQQAITQGLSVSFDVSQRLHEAGNITDLELARERALVEESKLQLRTAEVAMRQSQEQLNGLLGLWGNDTAWHIHPRLPDIPSQPAVFTDLEHRALRQSIDLASARQRVIAAGEQVGFSRATALLPDLDVGPVAERSEGAWEVGPKIDFPVPLFDQGQGRVGRAMAEFRRAQQEYYALGVEIRATVRAIHDRLQGAQDRALYYRDILLPLLERIINEVQLQYNAMQIGVFELLRARERQIQTAVAYIDTLLDYWLAHTDLDHLLSGRLPSPNGVAMNRRARPANLAERPGH